MSRARLHALVALTALALLVGTLYLIVGRGARAGQTAETGGTNIPARKADSIGEQAKEGPGTQAPVLDKLGDISALREIDLPVVLIERAYDPKLERVMEWRRDRLAIRDAFRETHGIPESHRWSREERDQLRTILNEERLRRFDTDGDGYVDMFEGHILDRPEIEQSLQGQRLLDRFDLDQNMIIDSEEQAALDAHYQRELEIEFDTNYARFDTNGDRRLSAQERVAVAGWQRDLIAQAMLDAGQRDERQERIRILKIWLDTDNTGAVTPDDYAGFLRNYRRGGKLADMTRDGVVNIEDVYRYTEMMRELRALQSHP